MYTYIYIYKFSLSRSRLFSRSHFTQHPIGMIVKIERLKSIQSRDKKPTIDLSCSPLRRKAVSFSEIDHSFFTLIDRCVHTVIGRT